MIGPVLDSERLEKAESAPPAQQAETEAASGALRPSQVPVKGTVRPRLSKAARQERARSELADQIMAVWRQEGGITVALYGFKVHAGGGEFRRQATQFAIDHGAVGLSGGEARAGVAIEITKSISGLLGDLETAISALLSESVRIPVQTLAIFTHGIERELEAGPVGGAQAAVGWISDVKTWVDQIAPYLSLAPRVLLYACRTGGQPAKGIPFAAGAAQYLQEALEALHPDDVSRVAPEVWAHKTRAHTTANPTLVKYGGAGPASAAEDFEQRLASAMVTAAIQLAGRDAVGAGTAGLPAVTEGQREALTRDAMRGVRRIFRTTSEETDIKSPKNDYLREVAFMGIDRAVGDLISETVPDFSALGLTAEAAKRVSDGFVAFKRLLDTELARLASLASVAGLGDFAVPRQGGTRPA